MALSDRKRVDHELKRLGFGGLDDPNLIPQIAFFIKNHEQFMKQLFSVKPAERRHAYNALRPHLRFPAKPLDVYEAEMKDLADRQQLPIFDGSAYGKPYKTTEVRLKEVAEEAIAQNLHEKEGGLTVACNKCKGTKIFRAPTRKAAERAAHAEGWRSDGEKCWCPEHVPARCTMTLECQDCERAYRLRCWDPQDGYAKARLGGWVIETAATCPKCAAKTVLVQ
jgi:hypothetical protein